MKSICVFAGSAKGVRESYSKSAKDLGLEIARREFSMVYGGGSKENSLLAISRPKSFALLE